MLNRENIKAKIEEIARAEMASLLSFKVFFSQGASAIRATVDYPKGGITLGTCARINKALDSYLQEEGLEGKYTIEINSPGLDRLLKEPGDFLRLEGRQAGFWLREPVCGKEYLEGVILEVGDKDLLLSYKENKVILSFDKIKTAKEKIFT
jgi:ribosome maturation factor RimP